MNCKEIEILLTDYIDGTLDSRLSEKVDAHLQNCSQCSQKLNEYIGLFQTIGEVKDQQPDGSLRDNFMAMLEQEKQNLTLHNNTQKPGKSITLNPVVYRIAAAIALLITGFLFGIQYNKSDKELAKSEIEIKALRNDVKEMKELVMFSMLKEESASARIKAVNYTKDIKEADQEVILALVDALNTDKNINVRIAAANALARFPHDKTVRASLITSLSKQSDPGVQITLINLLVEMEEKRALAPIRNIIKDKNTMKLVKEHAEKSIGVLL